MVILRSAFTVKIGGVEVKQYVNDYKLVQGRGQPFPVIRMVLSPANKVDDIATVTEGSALTVSACGEGDFIITDIDKEDNEYHITGIHKSVRLKEQTTSDYSAITPEGIFTSLATSLGYASGDISAPATSYGNIAIPGGENAWEVIKYLADLTGRRAFFTSSKAYFIANPSATTITIGGATPTVTPLTRPAVLRGNDDVINSVRVLYEMGEVTDSDATSIATHGERRKERRSFTTEDPDSHALPRVDAVNLASQLIADNKDPVTGLRYQVRERKRDVSDNQVWEQSHPIDSVGTITDNYSSTTLTAVALERVTHHYPMIATTYEWGQMGDELGKEISRLSSEVADRVHNGTLGNDLSSRPVAIQVYGDQDLEGFNPDTLTGFYLGKKKDALGNDVYVWAGVNAGTEQVRMDTDGKMKAGADAVVMDSMGIRISNQGKEPEFMAPSNKLTFTDGNDNPMGEMFLDNSGPWGGLRILSKNMFTATGKTSSLAIGGDGLLYAYGSGVYTQCIGTGNNNDNLRFKRDSVWHYNLNNRAWMPRSFSDQYHDRFEWRIGPGPDLWGGPWQDEMIRMVLNSSRLDVSGTTCGVRLPLRSKAEVQSTAQVGDLFFGTGHSGFGGLRLTWCSEVSGSTRTFTGVASGSYFTW